MSRSVTLRLLKTALISSQLDLDEQDRDHRAANDADRQKRSSTPPIDVEGDRLMSNGDMESRTRPKPAGPREVRYLLELTLAYSAGLRDVIEVIELAMREHPDILARYAAPLDHLRALVSPGDGGLVAIERECRILLGESTS